MIDTFQRYKEGYLLTKDLINKKETIINLLDVGSNGPGFGVYNTFKKVKQTNLDIQVFDKKTIEEYPNIKFITYDGHKFPFENKSFDVVLCSDTLEHIPPVYRKSFIKEILRVSKEFVVFSFPVSSSKPFEIFLYEITLHKSLFLKEHIQYGLPQITKFENQIKKSSFVIEKSTENINRFLWIPIKLLSSTLTRFWSKKDKRFLQKKFLKYVQKDHTFINFGKGYSKTLILKRRNNE